MSTLDRISLYHRGKNIANMKKRLPIVILAIVFGVNIFQAFFIKPVYITDDIMEPASPPGFYYFRISGSQNIKKMVRGQIIAFSDPRELNKKPFLIAIKNFASLITFGIYVPHHKKVYVRRIIGLPGEYVQIVNKQIYINQKLFTPRWNFKMSDPRILASEILNRDNMDSVFVSENSVFVMADNWEKMSDSRNFGVIPIKSIKGILIQNR